MINKQTLKTWWDVFVGDSNFTEIRLLGKFTYSGYFNSYEAIEKAIEPYSELEEEQMYFVINKIDDACYGRQQTGKIVKSPKITTNDTDIVRRRWVLCDFDPVRKSGTNSSNEELEYAHKRAQDVFKFLRSKGFSEPVICMSGNGYHLMYNIDEDVSDETKETIKGFYKYLAQEYSDDKVDFDQKNFNEARICKLYGTIAKKGANLQDRPWRESKILYVPKEIKTTPLAKFKELADLVPKEEPKQQVNQRRSNLSNAQFDLDTWLNEHNIVYRTKQSGNSTLYELEYCPWVDTHSDKKKWDSALFKDADGKITFNCTHSHCHGKTWQDVRLFYEPDAYSKPYNVQQPIYVPIQYQQPQQRKKYEIKDVLPELGDKWLSMSTIQKVDISQLDGAKSGIQGMDAKIVKLFYSEVTILSGSNSSGKSSFLNTLILNFVTQGILCALWSGELRPDIQKTWLQMVAAGKRNMRMSNYGDGKYYVPNNVAEKIDAWLDGKFFLYNNEYGSTWEQIFHDMEELLKAGVKIFILDNLFSLDIDLLEGDKNNKQKQLILQIKDFAKKNEVHVILVAHPRKATAFLRKNDICGSSDLQNAVDNILIMHRVNQDFLKSGADFYGNAIIQQYHSFGNVIEIAKNRMFGAVDVLVGLHYEEESRRFKNTIDEDVRYGWEQEPKEANMEFAQQQSYVEPNNDDDPFGGNTIDVAPF